MDRAGRDGRTSKGDVKELRSEIKRIVNENKELLKTQKQLRIQLENAEEEALRQRQLNESQVQELILLRLKMEEMSAVRTQLEQRVTELECELDSTQKSKLNSQSTRVHAGTPAQRNASAEATSSSTLVYTKLKSGANMMGEDYEVKMLALLFLRAVNENYEFFLASNFKAGGLFDDIVFKYRPTGGQEDWNTTFIQLKHKESKQVTLSQLLALGGGNKSDFSLKKYCNSYLQMKSSYDTNEELQYLGKFSDFKFVLYTNASLEKSIIQNSKRKEVSLMDTALLSTGRSGIVTSLLHNNVLMKSLKETVDFKTLLEVYLKTPTEEESANDERKLKLFGVTHFKENQELYNKCKELKQSLNTESVDKCFTDMSNIPNLEMYKEFLSNLRLFACQAKEADLDEIIKQEIVRSFQVLDEKELKHLFVELFEAIKKWWQNSKMYLTENAEFWKSLKNNWIQSLSSAKEEELMSLNVSFRPAATEALGMKLPKSGILNVVVSGFTTSLTCLKVYEIQSSFKDKHRIFVGLQAMLGEQQEAILCAWQQKWCRLLVVECEPNVTGDEVKGLSLRLQKAIHEDPNLTVVLISRSTDAIVEHLKCDLLSYDECNDECRWSDLNEESRTRTVDCIVNFQGQNISLQSLVFQDERLTKQIKGDTLYKLLNEDVTIGLELGIEIKYYIPRKLNHKGRVFNVNSYKNVKSRVVLLTAEPGMGKSTLLTHLAKSAKLNEPSKWIVRINLQDCSTYLKNLKDNEIDISLKNTVAFMKEFCLSKSSSSLEEAIFEHCLTVSGNMVVFIDAFDEICPIYKTEVCSLIRHLITMKVETIWISSRLGEKHELERTMDMQSISMESFTKEDQLSFLRMFWSERIVDVAEKQLTLFTDKVLELAEDAFKGDNLVISIPQQTRMLGEFFEDKLTSYNSTKLLNLNMSLNILNLYNHFVEKKFELYVKEKKQDTASIASTLNDNEEIHKSFIENHKTAALMLLLSADELSRLGITDSKINDFVLRINEGREKTGIIDKMVNDKPNFIHRTFAEYFAAMWFAENYSHHRDFLQTKLFAEGFEVIKTMFDLQLAKNFELHTAVLNGDQETVLRLLDEPNADVNQVDAGGRTALHLVSAHRGTKSRSNMAEIAKTLLHHEANHDKVDDVLHWRPLQYADLSSSWTIAGLILQKGGNFEDMTNTNNTMNTEVFQELMNFITSDCKDYVGLMHCASAHGHLDVITYLMDEHGADVNCKDESGATGMHKAAQAGQIEVMRYLGDKGASYTDADNSNTTPILFAVEHNHTEAVDYLLKQQVNLKSEDLQLMTQEQLNISLLLAAYQGNVKLAKELIARKAFVSYVNKAGTTPLHWAAYRNNVELVALLLKKRADVNAKDNEGLTPLFKTVEIKNNEEQSSSTKEGNTRLKIVRLLINSNGACFIASVNGENYSILNYAKKHNHVNLISYLQNEDHTFVSEAELSSRSGDMEKFKSYVGRGLLNMLEDGGISALFVATEIGNLEMVNYLLEYLPDVNVRSSDHKRSSLLMIAAHKGFVQIVDMLLKKGADAEAVNVVGDTALHYAVDGKHLDAVQCILRHSCSTIHVRNIGGFSPLLLAIQGKNFPIIEYLLMKGADISDANKQGFNSLHIAVCTANAELTCFLSKHRFLLDSRNAEGNTPLHLAAEVGSKQCLANLIENGADVTIVNNVGLNSLHLAAGKGNVELTSILSKHRVLLEARDTNGDTPLAYAMKPGAKNCVEVLIEHGADVNTVNDKGALPLHLALFWKYLDIATFLLESGALVNVQDKQKLSALHVAAFQGYHDMIAMLLEKGADIKAVDINSELALHLAAKHCHLECVQVLIQHDSPLDYRNIAGDTPLHIAIKKSSAHIVQLLVENGADITVRNNRLSPLKMAKLLKDQNILHILEQRNKQG